jgi:chemotaxis protein CheZ
MADETLALSTIPPSLPVDADYDAVHAAVMATMRGRWFLEEYAKRARNADTRLLLQAVERIEGVIRRGQAREASQGVRVELLEMAKAIAQTRADIAEMKPGDGEVSPEDGPVPESATDILATAGRLQDAAWTMRERGVDMRTCDQIVEVAGAIRAAHMLRAADDQRSQKLGWVLNYLERRIEAMLDAATVAAAAAEPAATTSEPMPPPGSEPATLAELKAVADPLADVAAAMAALMQPQEIPDEPPSGPEPTAIPEPFCAPEPSPSDPLPQAAALEPEPVPTHDQESAAMPADPPEDFLLTPMAVPAPAPAAVAAPPVEPIEAEVTPTPVPSDPLAALKAMSDEERIALFT